MTANMAQPAATITAIVGVIVSASVSAQRLTH